MRHLQAPVGAPPVELGQLGGGEGRPDPPPQLFPDRVDDPVGEPPGARVVDSLQRAPALLPLEQRVLERIAHARRGYPRQAVAVRRCGDFAQRGVGGAAGGRVERAATRQTVTGPLRRIGTTARSPRSQRASGEGIGLPGWRKLRKGEVTR